MLHVMRTGNISGGTFTIPKGWNLNFDVFPPQCKDCGSCLKDRNEACSFCLRNSLRKLLKQEPKLSIKDRMRAMMYTQTFT